MYVAAHQGDMLNRHRNSSMGVVDDVTQVAKWSGINEWMHKCPYW